MLQVKPVELRMVNVKRYIMIVTLILAAMVYTDAHAVYADYNYYNSDTDCEVACTGYAWKKAAEWWGIIFPDNWGHAKDWYGNAGDPYTKDQTPDLFSIACWSAEGSGNGYGHVALVTEVGDNYIKISEGGSRWDGATSEGICNRVIYTWSTLDGKLTWPDQGFIHLSPSFGTLEISCVLDAKFSEEHRGIGYFDLYLNGTLIGSDLESYSNNHIANGTSYQIANIREADDTLYSGVWSSGSLEGVIVTDTTSSVWLQFGSAYTINYDANTDDTVFDKPEAQKTNKGKPILISASRPRRTGYTFLGWATSASDKEAIYQPGDLYSENKNITLYALWEKSESFSPILFELQDGIWNETPDASVSNQKDYILPTTVPEKAGYTFINWAVYRYALISTPAFIMYANPGDAISPEVTEGYITVFLANYQKTAARLVFKANGGTVSPLSRFVKFGEAYGTLPIPERPGYHFDGWYTAADGGSAVSSATVLQGEKNETIYAHWSELPETRLPAALTVLEPEAFMGTYVSRVYVPDQCTQIANKAFANCTDLIYIQIPNPNTEIAYDAFEGSNHVTIYCASNSIAHQFTSLYGYSFVLIGADGMPLEDGSSDTEDSGMYDSTEAYINAKERIIDNPNSTHEEVFDAKIAIISILIYDHRFEEAEILLEEFDGEELSNEESQRIQMQYSELAKERAK